MSFENGYELGWDSEITNEGKDFVIAEPGDYEFTVTGFERKRHNGSAKMPACNYAELSIKLNISNGECIVKDKLFLHSKTEWKISEFFLGIGQKKKVYVMKMIASGSIEEKVLALQRRKQAIINATVDTTDTAIMESLTAADFDELLS